MRISSRCVRRRNAVAAVELALLLPLLCFLFVVAVDFGRVFAFSLTLTNAARNGAVHGSADRGAAVDRTGIENAVRADATNLDSQKLTVTSSVDDASNPTYVDVTVTYPFDTITRYPGVPSQTFLRRTVRMRVAPDTPAGS
jgi:Flp pilus assembly protein TadG